MKAFTLSSDQIAAIIGALVADELGWRFKRHMDSLTIASLSPTTRLKDGDLDLDAEQYAACAGRAARFFGADAALLAEPGAETVADWAGAIEAHIGRTLTHFSFTPAGRDSETGACRHRADAIYAAAAAVSHLLYGRRRIFSLVAPHSLMGFILTVLTPNLQQIPAVDARGLPPEDLNSALEFGDALVATPTLWRYLLKENLRAPDNTLAIAFGEPMTPDLAAALRKAGFGAQRELYGSTENGVVGWRDSPSEAFLLFDSVLRAGDALVRVAPDGARETLLPMDVMTWEDDRRFRLAGRRDGAVQVGAVNVFPDRIAGVIAAHDEVARCDVRLAEANDGAHRLVAHIVLRSGASPTESVARSIDAWCRAQLRPHERPRIYNFDADARPDA